MSTQLGTDGLVRPPLLSSFTYSTSPAYSTPHNYKHTPNARAKTRSSPLLWRVSCVLRAAPRSIVSVAPPLQPDRSPRLPDNPTCPRRTGRFLTICRLWSTNHQGCMSDAAFTPHASSSAGVPRFVSKPPTSIGCLWVCATSTTLAHPLRCPIGPPQAAS